MYVHSRARSHHIFRGILAALSQLAICTFAPTSEKNSSEAYTPLQNQHESRKSALRKGQQSKSANYPLPHTIIIPRRFIYQAMQELYHQPSQGVAAVRTTKTILAYCCKLPMTALYFVLRTYNNDGSGHQRKLRTALKFGVGLRQGSHTFPN